MLKAFFLALLALAFASPATPATSGATGQVSVTTSATLIAAARIFGATPGRSRITVINITGTDKLCLGFDNTVTAATGQCLPAVAGAAHTFETTSAIYGIVPTTTQVVSFAETF